MSRTYPTIPSCGFLRLPHVLPFSPSAKARGGKAAVLDAIPKPIKLIPAPQMASRGYMGAH